jgi:drug/metabolite transporter (DMT)-like permease
MTDGYGKLLTGVGLASFAGCCWGAMSVAAQYLFAEGGFRSDDLTALRLLGAGVLLLIIPVLSGQNPFAALKDRKNFRDIFLYGLGIMCVQYTFFIAIEVSNAATAALMVGFVPLFVVMFLFFMEGRRPHKKEWVALVLALFGVSMIVTKGNFSTLDLSAQGVLWGLASAASGAFCSLQPRAVIKRVGVTTVIGWGMLVGGAVLSLFSNPFSSDCVWSWTNFACYFFIVFIGTVVAFWCFLKSYSFISPSITSILSSFEPLSSVVLSVVLLGTTFNSCELAGAAAIVGNMVLLAWPEKGPSK